MKLAVRNAQGGKLKPIEVDDQVFGIKPNMAVMHQAFLAQMANRRAGSASTKSRGEVRGSSAKVRVQTGSGNARQGTARAPHRTGGGVAFGPRPRSYRQALPKRMKRLAIRSVLSGKVADGQVAVVDKLSLEKPRTKEIVELLESLGIKRSSLIVMGDADRMVFASARNLARIKAMPAAYLNVVDMLTHRDLVMTVAAVRRCEELWGGDRARQRRPVAVQAAPPPTAKTRRPRVAKAPGVAEEAAGEAEVAVEATAAAVEAPAAAVEAPAAPKTVRHTRAPKKAEVAGEAVAEAEVVAEATGKAAAAVEAPAAPKTVRRTRAPKKAEVVEEAAGEAQAVEADNTAKQEAS
jgi:large subunit ribosomal protein L4